MSVSPTKFRRSSSASISPCLSSTRSLSGRRWSLDSTHEGYVKDLRKYQSSSRDESYPFMLTEKQKKGNKSGEGYSPATSRKGMYGRGHSMDVSTFVVPEDFEMTQSSYNIYGSENSTSLRTPIGIDEHRPLMSLRQRSSSLPRILPPILDDENDKSHYHQPSPFPTHQRKSIAGTLLSSPCSTSINPAANGKFTAAATLVREMQKFVCRQADDVSYLLPLPLPSKLSLIIKEEEEGDEDKIMSHSPFFEQSQASYALGDLAKVHASSLAMKRVVPQLFEDVIRMLDMKSLSSPHHAFYSQSNSTLSTAQLRKADLENRIKDSCLHDDGFLKEKALEFLSKKSFDLNPKNSLEGLCLNEDLNVKSITFRYSADGNEILGCKFGRVSRSTVGPFLGDLYTFLFNCVDPRTPRDSARELLESYHYSLNRSLKDLKIVNTGLDDIEDFLRLFKENLECGFLIGYLLCTNNSGLREKSEAKEKMEKLKKTMSYI